MGTRQQSGKKSFSKLESMLTQFSSGQQGEYFDFKAFFKKIERENQYMSKDEAMIRFLYELSKGM